MREKALAAAAIACATAVAPPVGFAEAGSSDSPLAAPLHANAVVAGARLAALGNCAVCHTAAGGAPFAGGRPFHTQFGTLYSTNITPDPETGLGRWSLGDFSRSMKSGVSRD